MKKNIIKSVLGCSSKNSCSDNFFAISLNHPLLQLFHLSGASVLSQSSVALLDHSFLAATAFWWFLGLTTFAITFFQVKNPHLQVQWERRIHRIQSRSTRDSELFWWILSLAIDVLWDTFQNVGDFHILFLI